MGVNRAAGTRDNAPAAYAPCALFEWRGFMSRIGSIARLPAGRRGKWVVVAFWLIVVALAGPLAGKPARTG